MSNALIDWDAELRARTLALAAAASKALPNYVERVVLEVMARRGAEPDEGQVELIRIAGTSAVAAIVPQIEHLAEQDVDGQATTPLAILREAFHFPTSLMDAWGEPVGGRDPYATSAFPEDVYDVLPGSFKEVDESLFEPGLAWGVAKARAHSARHKRKDTP
jgi:hypothetical protein